MAHTITEACIGCGACVKVCPTNAVSGEKKSIHTINTSKCIDCSVCGMTCTKNAVLDQNGNTIMRLKISERLKPVINKTLCSGCYLCGEFCHVKAIKISEPAFHGDLNTYAEANFARCVGCGVCVSVCPTEAISMQKAANPPDAADTKD